MNLLWIEAVGTRMLLGVLAGSIKPLFEEDPHFYTACCGISQSIY